MSARTALALMATLAAPVVLSAQVRTERRIAGDTTIVRITGTEPAPATRHLVKVFSFGKAVGADEYLFGRLSGIKLGPDGSVWVFDQQVPVLRQYDSTGTYIKKVGRGGQGPGEYGPLVGLAFPPNGTAVISDRRASLLHVFSASGSLIAEWALPQDAPSRPGVSLTSGGVVSDTAGRIYVRGAIGSRPPGRDDPRPQAIQGLVVYGPGGTVRDSLALPRLGVPSQTLSTGALSIGIPYLPSEFWSFSKLGYFVGGRSDTYEIHLAHTGGRVTRIERDIPRVPIPAAQRQSVIDQITATARQKDPLWRWNGPEVPRVKPYFQNILTDDDGRIWVMLHTPSERIPTSEVAAPSGSGRARGGSPPASVSRDQYREPILWEVFAPDGRYLGRVELPEFGYQPAIKGNAVWMATIDVNDVPVVTKFQITPPLPR
jgi:hypothetical protein